jgi:hypothetical protein
MTELHDYSGPFKPDLTLADFSKDLLLQLIPHWQWTGFQMDAAWWDGIDKRYGPEFAWQANLQVYTLDVPERCNLRYARIFNIKRENVVDSLKILQLPWDNTMGGQYPTLYDIQDENHATLSVYGCPNLEWYEKAAPERIFPQCHVNEEKMIQGYACNPNLRVRATKLPPRQSPKEMACQFEHRIDFPEGYWGRIRSKEEVVDESPTEEIPELEDYSGPFYPNLTHRNLSKSLLIKLMRAWQSTLLVVNQGYYDRVVDKYGREAANEINRESWQRVIKRCNRRYLETAKIELKTVLDSLKCLQLPMASNIGGGLFPASYEIENDNHVIMTITRCRTLQTWEKEAPEMIDAVCHTSEQETIRQLLLNPNIQVTPLKLPPRAGEGDFACRWELRLED